MMTIFQHHQTRPFAFFLTTISLLSTFIIAIPSAFEKSEPRVVSVGVVTPQ